MISLTNTKNSLLTSKSTLAKITILFFGLFVTLMLLTQAASAIIPSPDPSPITPTAWWYQASADSQPNSPTLGGWIAPSANRSLEIMPVAYGTPSVSLSYTSIGTVGWRPSSTTRTLYYVAGESAGVSGAVGQANIVNFGIFANTPGATNYDYFDFTFSPPGGFTVSGTYYVQLDTYIVNEFSGGFSRCVANNAPAANILDIYACPLTPQLFSIEISVTPQPDSCDNLPGIQNGIPAGYVRAGVNDCVQPDSCDNLPGIQNGIPAGYVRAGVNDCVIPNVMDCPTFTTRFHGVSMANTSFGLANVAGSSGNTSAPGNYTGRVLGNVSFTRSSDISTPGPAIPIPTRNAVTGTTGSVELDYGAFSDQYPYDSNRASATFTMSYVETNYYTTENWRTRTIDPPDPDGAGPLPDPPPYNENYIFDYTWNAGAPVSGAIEGSVAGPSMPPCYNRNFDTIPTAPAGALLDPNTEDPSRAYALFTFPTVYGVESIPARGNLRKGTQVNSLNYTINWRIEGYTTTVPNSAGSSSGSVAISASGTSTSGTGNAQSALYSSIPNGLVVRVPVNLEAGKRVCFSMTTPLSRGVVDENGTTLSSNTSRTSADACTAYVRDRPYSRFYGADIFAGGGFTDPDGTCSVTNPNATARGVINGTNAASFRGTGAQLAVFALAQIQDVPALSQSGRSPLGLSFANSGFIPPPNVTVGESSGSFGGGFKKVSCAYNYFSDVPSASTIPSPGAINLADAALPSGRYSYTGNTNIYGLIPPGKRVVIYVDGDVSITANNTTTAVGTVGFNSTSWASISEIPSLYIIARGNILIDDGITGLDGTFIAQPRIDNTGGEIYTCTIGTSLPTAQQQTEECRTKLLVNGAFIAKKINLNRTFGSLRSSSVGEGPNPTNAGETFIYDPTVWFTSGGNLPVNQNVQIESYVSLPPSL